MLKLGYTVFRVKTRRNLSRACKMPADNVPLRLPLLQFLRQSRQLHLQHISGTWTAPVPIYVLGNTSADLDSMISAIVYSYFASGNPYHSSHGRRPHIPLVNLPEVPSGHELRRMRPEFVTALWLSTGLNSISSATSGKKGTSSVTQTEKENGRQRQDTSESSEFVDNVLREHVLTVADLKEQNSGRRWRLDTVMVDWNAFPSSRPANTAIGKVGTLDALPSVDFNVVGCIDHHADEGFVSQTPSGGSSPSLPEPVVVELGPGSCASIVVRELAWSGLWDGCSPLGELQLAKLALAPILIDTNDLEYKATDVDRHAASFLEEKAQSAELHATASSSWNRHSFFQSISESKQNGIDLLTVPEILGRDYKEWNEGDAMHQVKIGIACCIKPVEYVVAKTKVEQNGSNNNADGDADTSLHLFINALRSFAALRKLDVVALMTAFSDKNDKFRRELLLYPLRSGAAEECCRRFASHSESELGLVTWSLASVSPSYEMQGTGNDSSDVASFLNRDSPFWCRLWEQKDVSKSRKKVAPLLRGEVSRL